MRCSKNVDSIEYQRIFTIGLPQMCDGRTIFQHDGAQSVPKYVTVFGAESC